MEYNKNQFSKISDKKVLHKKGKKWITLSLGLLMAIGGTAAVSRADTTTNADTTTPNNNQQKQSSTGQVPKYNLQSATPQAQSNQSGTDNGRKLTSNTPNLKMIGKQANALHQNIILNNLNKSQTNAPQTKANNSANASKNAEPESGNNHSTSYSVAPVKSSANNVPSSAPIHQTAKPNSAYANYLKMMGGSSAYDQMMNNEAKQQNKTNDNVVKNNKLKSLGDYSVGQATPDKTHWIYTSDGYGDSGYLSDGQISDWTNGSSSDLNYRYSKDTNAIEFTSGDYTYYPGYSQFMSINILGNIPLGNVTSIKFNKEADVHPSESFGGGYSNLFQGSNKLKSVYLSSDFNNTSETSSMFSRDTNLVHIYFPANFGQHIKYASDMFSSDTSLSDLDLHSLAGFGQHISDTINMFSHDTNLTKLVLPANFGQQIDLASGMFSNDTNLTKLVLPANFGQHINSADNMFSNDTSLNKLILPANFGQHINSADNMFSNDTSLNKLILPANFGQHINSAKYMFSNDTSLNKLILPANFGQHINDASDMFSNDTSLNKLILPANFGQQISSADNMFSSDTSLSDLDLHSLAGFGQHIIDTINMFSNDTNLTKLVLPANFGQQIDLASDMFSNDTNLTKLALPANFGQQISSADNMFSNDTSLKQLILPNGFDQQIREYGVSNMFNSVTYYKLEDMGNGITQTNSDDYLTSDIAYHDAQNGINMGGTYLNYFEGTYDGLHYKQTTSDVNGNLERYTTFDKGTLNWSGSDNTNFMAYAPSDLKNSTTITFDNNVNVSNTHNLSNMFFNVPHLKSVNFNNVFQNVPISDMTDMFGNDQALSDADLSALNTSHVKSMANLFVNDQNLKSVNFGSNFNTKNVVDMAGMFMGDKDLSDIDLSRFDTRNVNTMLDMFAGDSKLTSLSFPSDFKTSDVVDMAGMFSGLSDLNSNLDVSKFHTSKVKDMSSMFAGDPLYQITGISDLKTSDVKDMNSMFFDTIGNQTSLDLSNFNTANVSDMRDMFGMDSDLTSLTVGPNFDTTKSINKQYHVANNDGTKSDCDGEKYMFESDVNLTNIISKSNHFVLGHDAMQDHANVPNSTVSHMLGVHRQPLMSMVETHRPLLGAYSFNPSTSDYDEIIYYNGDKSNIVGHTIMHGATGQSDSGLMSELSAGTLPGLDITKYYVANKDQLLDAQQERFDYDNQPVYIGVAPVKKGHDTIEYVTSNDDVIGSYLENGSQGSSDTDITRDLQSIASGKIVGTLNSDYGITPQGKNNAEDEALVKYDHKNGIAKINVKPLSSDVVRYVDGNDNQLLNSDHFKGVNPWTDTKVHQAIYGFLNGNGGYNFPSDYYLAAQGNQDISNALHITYNYNNPDITIHLAKKHPDTINIVSDNGSLVKSFHSDGIPNHQDSQFINHLNSVQSNVDYFIHNGVYDEQHNPGYVLTSAGKATLQNAMKGQYNYNDSTVNVQVQAKQPDHLTFKDVSDHNTPYTINYYGQRGANDSGINDDLNKAAKGTIDYDFNDGVASDEFFITSSDRQKARLDAQTHYTYNKDNVTVPIHKKYWNAIQFYDDRDNSDVGISYYYGPKYPLVGSKDNRINQALSDISNNINDGFAFDRKNYRFDSDSSQIADNNKSKNYQYDNRTVVNIPVRPIQYGTNTIEYDYNGHKINGQNHSLVETGETGDHDTSITTSDVVRNQIGKTSDISYENSSINDDDGNSMGIAYPDVDTSTYYVSSDAMSALQNYVTQHPNFFDFNNNTYHLNLSKYPSGINAVDLVTSDNHIIKQYTLSDVSKHAFNWTSFIKQYPNMDPTSTLNHTQLAYSYPNLTTNSSTDNKGKTLLDLNDFDPVGNSDNYQLSPEGQYEYTLLHDNDLSGLDFNGHVLKINVQPKDIATFTANYTINGKPYVTMQSSGRYDYRVDNQNYLNTKVYRVINGQRVYLNSNILQPLLDTGSSLEMDPRYQGIENTRFLYKNQTVTIPLVSKTSMDTFKYMAPGHNNPVYVAGIIGGTDTETSDTSRTKNNAGIIMPRGVPNLNTRASDNHQYAGKPGGIPDALVNYKFANGYPGIKNATFDGSSTTIPVVRTSDTVSIPASYQVKYHDENDNYTMEPQQNNLYSDTYNYLINEVQSKDNNILNPTKSDTSATLWATLSNLGGLPRYFELDTNNLVAGTGFNKENNTHFVELNVKQKTADDNVVFNGDYKANYSIKHDVKQGSNWTVQAPNGYSFVTDKPSDTTDASVSHNQGHFVVDGGTHVFTVQRDKLLPLPKQSASATETVNYNWIYNMGHGSTSTSTSTSSIVATYNRSDTFDKTTGSSFVSDWRPTNLASFSAVSAPKSLGWHLSSASTFGDVSSVNSNGFISDGNGGYNSSASDDLYMVQDSTNASATTSSASVIVNYLDKSGYNPSVASPYSSAIAYSREKYTDTSNTSNSSFGDWSTNSSMALPKSAAPRGMHVVSVSVTNTLPSPGSAVDDITGDEYVENVYYSDIINHNPDYASAIDTTNYYINGTKSALSSATQDSIEYSRADEYNERLNSYINYGSWSTSSTFNKISYPSELVSNGRYYYESSADVSLPSVAQNSLTSKQASYSNNVYYTLHSAQVHVYFENAKGQNLLPSGSYSNVAVTPYSNVNLDNLVSGYHDKISGYHFVNVLNSLSQYSDRDNGAHNVYLLYAPNTNSKDYEPAIDTIEYLISGTNSSISSATNNVVEFSRANVDDSPSGNWAGSTFSSISYPSEISASGSYYHEVSANDAVPNSGEVTASLNDSANHSAHFDNNVYYALDSIIPKSETASATETTYYYWNNGSSNVSAASAVSTYGYSRSASYDSNTQSYITSFGDWSLNSSSTSSASNITSNGYHFDHSFGSLPNSSVVSNDLVAGKDINYAKYMVYLPDNINHSKDYGIVTDTVNYLINETSSAVSSASSRSLFYSRANSMDNTTNHDSTSDWQTSGSFDQINVPKSITSKGITYREVSTNTNSALPNISEISSALNKPKHSASFANDIYYAPDSYSDGSQTATVDENVDYVFHSKGGSSIASANMESIGYTRPDKYDTTTHSVTSTGSWSADSSFAMPTSTKSGWSAITSNLASPSSSNLQPNETSSYNYRIDYAPVASTSTSSAHVTNIVKYLISGSSNAFYSASETINYYRTATTISGMPTSYSKWTTDSAFTPIDYSSESTVNGAHYHEVSANVALPTDSQVSDKLNSSRSAIFSGDAVYYALDKADIDINYENADNGSQLSSKSLNANVNAPFSIASYAPATISANGKDYHQVDILNPLTSFGSQNSETQTINVLYASDTEHNDYAPVVDTVEYLVSGTDSSISSAATNVVEFSRADLNNSNKPSYGSWTGSTFSSISYPSEISANNSYYHLVSGNTSLPSDSAINKSLSSSNVNHAAQFSNVAYYALDSSSQAVQSAFVNETMDHVFYSEGGSSVAPTSMSAMEYNRPYTYDVNTKRIISMGAWNTSYATHFPVNSSVAGWTAIASNLAAPNVSSLSSGEQSSYAYQIDYVSNVNSYHTSFASSTATEYINYIESNGTRSTYSNSVNVNRTYLENNSNSILSTGAWSASTSFSIPSSASFSGWMPDTSSGDIPENTKYISPGKYSESVNYVPTQASIDIYYENVDTGDEISGYSESVAKSSTGASFYISKYAKPISGYHLIQFVHDTDHFGANNGDVHTIDILYSPNTSSKDYAPVIDTVNYVVNSKGTNTPISSASNIITEYSRSDNVDGSSATYGSWTGSAFSSISYPSEISANGKYYHKVSSDNAQINSSTINSILDKSAVNHSAKFNNNVVYVPDSYSEGSQTATINEAVNYVFHSKGGSSSSTANVGPVKYTRSYIYDSYNNNSIISEGSWIASGSTSLPASASMPGWSALTSNMASPDSTNLHPNSSSNYNYQVNYAPTYASIDIYYEDVDTGNEISGYSEKSLNSSTSAGFNVSTYTSSISGYHFIKADHAVSHFGANNGDVNVIDLLYAPNTSSKDYADVINTIHYVVNNNGKDTPISSATANVTEYSRADNVSGSSATYGSWEGSLSSVTSYPSEISVNGHYYHASRVGNLPDNGIINTSLNSSNVNHSASVNTNVYYASDGLSNGSQTANVNETIDYVFYSNGGSSIASSSTSNVEYTRSDKYDSYIHSAISVGSWKANGNFKLPSSLVSSGWTAFASNMASPDVTHLSASANSNYNYQVDYLSNAANSKMSLGVDSSTIDDVVQYYINNSLFSSSVSHNTYTRSDDVNTATGVHYYGSWTTSSNFNAVSYASDISHSDKNYHFSSADTSLPTLAQVNSVLDRSVKHYNGLGAVADKSDANFTNNVYYVSDSMSTENQSASTNETTYYDWFHNGSLMGSLANTTTYYYKRSASVDTHTGSLGSYSQWSLNGSSKSSNASNANLKGYHSDGSFGSLPNSTATNVLNYLVPGQATSYAEYYDYASNDTSYINSVASSSAAKALNSEASKLNSSASSAISNTSTSASSSASSAMSSAMSSAKRQCTSKQASISNSAARSASSAIASQSTSDSKSASSSANAAESSTNSSASSSASSALSSEASSLNSSASSAIDNATKSASSSASSAMSRAMSSAKRQCTSKQASISNSAARSASSAITSESTSDSKSASSSASAAESSTNSSASSSASSALSSEASSLNNSASSAISSTSTSASSSASVAISNAMSSAKVQCTSKQTSISNSAARSVSSAITSESTSDSKSASSSASAAESSTNSSASSSASSALSSEASSLNSSASSAIDDATKAAGSSASSAMSSVMSDAKSQCASKQASIKNSAARSAGSAIASQSTNDSNSASHSASGLISSANAAESSINSSASSSASSALSNEASSLSNSASTAISNALQSASSSANSAMRSAMSSAESDCSSECASISNNAAHSATSAENSINNSASASASAVLNSTASSLSSSASSAISSALMSANSSASSAMSSAMNNAKHQCASEQASIRNSASSSANAVINSVAKEPSSNGNHQASENSQSMAEPSSSATSYSSHASAAPASSMVVPQSTSASSTSSNVTGKTNSQNHDIAPASVSSIIDAPSSTNSNENNLSSESSATAHRSSMPINRRKSDPIIKHQSKPVNQERPKQSNHDIHNVTSVKSHLNSNVAVRHADPINQHQNVDNDPHSIDLGSDPSHVNELASNVKADKVHVNNRQTTHQSGKLPQTGEQPHQAALEALGTLSAMLGGLSALGAHRKRRHDN